MTENEYNRERTRATKLFARLKDDFFSSSKTFDGVIAVSKDPVHYSERENLSYKPISENLHWGELWDSAWIRLDGEIPADWAGKKILFQINLGGEVLVFDKDGVPFYSLTNTSSLAKHYRKEYLHFTDNAQAGKFSIWMEVAANGLFGDECNPDYPDQIADFGTIRKITYGVFNSDVWDFRLDMEIVMSLLHFPRTADDFGLVDTPAFPPKGAREKQIMAILRDAVNAYGDNPDNAMKARKILSQVLNTPAMASAMQVTAVGHAHIDTGWLWPVRETIRKCARTFASQLTLMDKYPDYVFGASQAQHYQFMKDNYPELYAKIRERIKEGRWEIHGGMWVECDCNLTGGEAMIRQFLHGKNFFKKEFGFDVKNVWIPDVFGYSAAMPQIMKKCGCNYFLTQKMCWNDTNKIPHHCFYWKGIDGTRMLSFFPPENTYNTTLTPDMLNFGANNLWENDFINEYISLFGIGDGGGGPKEEYIERGIRCQNLEGCPQVKFGRADDFLARLDKYGDKLATWDGELYLEMHRGTLTTQAKVKKGNRRCEEALMAVEALYAGSELANYPAKELDRLWKLLLLNQFHDILPGSSIGMVYERTHKEHQEILDCCSDLIKKFGNSEDENSLTLFNSLGVKFNGLVQLPANWSGAENYSIQYNENNLPCIYVEMQPFEKRLIRKETAKISPLQTSTELVLENALIRYEFNDKGEIISAYDKEENREIFCGTANKFVLYHDRPTVNDAWDIESCYENERFENIIQANTVSEVTCGTLWSEINFNLKLDKAEIKQIARLNHNSKQLEFITDVDWHESRRLLKVEFPIAGVNNKAHYDIQYGYTERPTHRNTSWDWAKFEVCMHKYMDLGNDDYGVAILNDCKYGVGVKENVVGLSLLRSPKYPDTAADMGQHSFRYAILPHTENFRIADVMESAAAFNREVLVLAGDASNKPLPIGLNTIRGCAVIESIKKAEDSDNLVVRIVEKHGRSAEAELQITDMSKNAYEIDMLEWQNGEKVENNILKFTPFEIKTIIIK
ncbi:MAG: alpha-mannosidase [Lentisphaeria bacterium]|nr:alpha-mannosidase [Lentisphaeria bacterium]